MLPLQLSSFGALVFYHSVVVILLLTTCCGGQPHLIGPSQPIVAVAGDDTVLSCHLEPPVDVFDMTVEWARPDLNPRFVHVWRSGVELASKKHPSYAGRTSLFINRLKLGDVSMTLSRVRLSDRGTYRCFVPGLYQAFLVELVVGAVSSPVVNVTNSTLSGVELRCESEGWYPEPEVLWLDAEGNLLSAGPTETVRGPDDLYTVSSRVTVEKRHSNSFTCRVQQKDINQTRETHIHVSDDLFVTPSSSSPDAFVITGSVVAIIVFALAVVSVIIWKCRANRSKTQRNQTANEEKEEQEKHLKSDSEGEAETEQLRTQSTSPNEESEHGRGTNHIPYSTNKEKKTTAASSDTEHQRLMEGGRNEEEAATEEEEEKMNPDKRREKTLFLSNNKESLRTVDLHESHQTESGQKDSEDTDTTYRRNQRQLETQREEKQSVQREINQRLSINMQKGTSEEEEVISDVEGNVQRKKEKFENHSKETKPKCENPELTKDKEMLREQRSVSKIIKRFRERR